MDLRQRRILTLAALVLIAVIVAVVFFGTRGNKKTPYQVYDSIAPNFSYPAVTPQGEIRFFTGSAVASFDDQKQTTKSLTTEFPLPDALEAHWNTAASELLIKTIAPQAGSRFFQTGSPAEVWWKLSVVDQSLTPVRCDEPTATLAGSNWNNAGRMVLLCTKTKNDAVRTTSSNHDELLVRTSITYRLVQADETQAIVIRGGTLQRISYANSNPVDLASGVGGAFVVGDKIYFSAQDSQGKGDETTERGLKLYTTDLAKESKPQLYDGGVLSGVISNIQPGIAAVSLTKKLNSPDLFALTIDKDNPSKVEELVLKGDERTASLGIRAIIRKNKRLYIASSDGLLFVAAKNDQELGDVKSSPLVVFDDVSFKVPGGSVVYDSIASRATITLTSPDAKASYDAVLDLMKEKGADPNLITKQWVFTK